MRLILLILCIYGFTGLHHVLPECPPIPGKTEVRPSRISPIKHLDYARARALAQGKTLTLPVTYNILVIRVEFALDSTSRTTGNGKFESGTTQSVVEAFMEKLKNYYTENSYAQLTASYTVTSIYSLSKAMSSYGTDTPYDQYDTLVEDIINTTTVAADHALAGFAHFMIYHAGAGQESDVTGDSPDDIWSAYVSDLGISCPISSATFVPEKENGSADPLGVICHEYGHQLGLPDLYYVDDSGSQNSTLGYWTLMDAGVWIGSPQGSNPSHLDAWSKLDLGFMTPQVISGDVSNLALLPSETSKSTFYKITIPIADDPEKEFFLVEYRYRNSGAVYDKYIPGDGILVYHVDNAIAQDSTRRNTANDVNSGFPHYGIDIEEADGTDSGRNLGDAGDAYGTGYNIFGAPLSRAYNGIESGITLTFNAASGSGSMSALSISYEPSMSIKKLINYPNPSSTGQTTFHIRLSRPHTDMELNIYTLAGERVRTLPKALFSIDSAKSSDNSWVYEYSWDGKNGEGDNVASGVYFYLLRVNDDKTKTGKLAIIK
ncbi:MAG: M6 family metalloprotease domain-containing protein [bacterium]